MTESKEELTEAERRLKFSKFLLIQSLIIGLLFAADQFFSFFEQNFFNTYLKHVLFLPDIYVSIMVSLSSVMGLIFCLVWGIKSDNTRSKWGRRRPYLLIGGTVSGVAMILYALSPNYWWALFFDVLIIGVASNMYFAAERALIPDTVEPSLRGRANGIITIFGNIGILFALIAFLLSYELFAIPNPSGSGTILTQEGHLFVLSMGGVFFLLCGIVGFAFIREIPNSEMPPKNKFSEELKEFFDLEEMKKQKEFFKIVGSYIIFKTGVTTVLTFLFIYLFWLGLTTLELFTAIGIAFIVLIFSTLTMGTLSDKFGRKKFVPLFIIIASFGFFLIPFAKLTETSPVNLLIFIIAIPFVVIGILGLPAPLDAWSQDLLPADKRGKFLGIYNLMWVVSQIIGSFIGGIIATFYGYPFIFFAGGFFMLLSIPFFIRVKETLKIEK
ncbi:MAG: MFS transporter [Candidatus Lokiarchaeota archaeon]|nr:MFS transporter [Candidatus Lokiarchaeota archaeon]